MRDREIEKMDAAKPFNHPREPRWVSLAQLAPCRHRKRADDLIAPHHHHLVPHVYDDPDAIRHDCADIWPGVAPGETKDPVFFRKSRDPRFGMFEDQAVAVESAAGV